MVLEIVKYGHPALRQKGTPVKKVNAEIRQLANDMLETMNDANGVGLAAQQVGVPIQLAVIDVAGIEDRPSTLSIDGKEVNIEEHMPLILINPELELGAEREEGIEGCLSFPEITAEISRSLRVKVRATDLDGKQLVFEATGLLSRALQHEVDHLHGILFIDRMKSATRTALTSRLKRMQKEAGTR
jgi:peptide deformylase